jgi:hypothetical protein
MIDTNKWLGSGRSPNDLLTPTTDAMPKYFHRNTHIEFPQNYMQMSHMHVNSHHHQFNRPFNYPQTDRLVFPTENSFPHEEIVRSTIGNNLHSSWTSKLPELNKNEKMKGSWKWVPESDEEIVTLQPEVKFHSFNSPTIIYEHNRGQTVRDRPYSFESSDIFSQHTTPPTGPSVTWSSNLLTEALSGGEEFTTGKSDETATSGEKHKNENSHVLDFKQLRKPSPWKKIIHVMSAAIPIGLIS